MILIILVLALMVALPFVFRGKLMELSRNEINKNLEARVDFEDFGMNMFAHFPNLSFWLDEITISGTGDLSGDTLASVSRLSVVFDIMSVIRGDEYEVRKISVLNPDISLKVMENGNPNWDILPEEEPASVEENSDQEATSFNVSLKKFEIINGLITYEDIPAGLKINATGLNHILSGNLSAAQTDLRTKTQINEFSAEQDGIAYMSNIFMAMDALIEADLVNEVYTFRENKLTLNELILQFEGSVDMGNTDPNIMLSFNAPENTFKNFLSLIPAIYSKDFNSLQASGNLAFNGYVKGSYTGSALPAFHLGINVDQASFQYPDLPSAVDQIYLNISLDNPGGDADNTVIDIKRFHFSMLDTPFEARLRVTHPVSDPYIDVRLNGEIDLSAVEKVYPLGGEAILAGTIDAGISVKGRQSSIENQDYDQFDAFGSLMLKDITYFMNENYEVTTIRRGQLNFTPRYIDFVNLDLKYGQSDMLLQGKLEDYILYAMGDHSLNGSFTGSSKVLNVNQLIGESEDADADQELTGGDTLALTTFMVPQKIDILIDASFDKVYYDNLELKNVNGKLIVRDEKVSLQNIQGDMLDGTFGLSGSYSTKNTTKAMVDFNLQLDKISFRQAFKSFGILQKFAPVFNRASGNFSTDMAFSTMLKEDMSPDYTSFIGSGILNTSALTVENLNTLNKLSDALKFESLKSLNIEPLNISFDIENGKLTVTPFDIVMKNMQAKLGGWTALDQTINYELKMQVPRSLFGTESNNVLDNLANQANAQGASITIGKTVNLDVLISGSLSDPVVKPLMGRSVNSIVEDIKQGVVDEIDKKKEELEQNAKAEAQKILNNAELQAAKVIEEAQKQAGQLRETARDAAAKVKKEADDHAQKLIAEGKKNGMLAEVAAKKTADEYKKNAYNQAGNMITEADKKADAIMQKANQQADKIRSDARKQADALL
ncbi:MAG: AsmA-like C-terminal region-containing protein [Bacteroidales bacterium]|nr:AsmA-like C-terminal region-containing protein [Bacteroidales bacterium]